ncbi:receptor-likey region, transmembrane domain- and RING domain-containing protein 1 [Melia azedarach]|uniref:Receptor-likey region, transmembrane domain- and RING domain-containing protein 1 n=1 Tax=Melia azedarach TaxID=155640 RepID=A0ACC1XSF3_MELAZ|nr:receptor-likey region, transmembrane domain- and RING domain-containing protein 1 [Melia azedarach]
MRNVLFGFFIHLSFVFSLSSATVLWRPLSVSFQDLPAKSAVDVSTSGICGALHVADPPHACHSLRNVFAANETDQIMFALIVRGQCTFDDKIRNAQSAGFRAAIVYDDRDKENLVYMMVNGEGIKVHATFISKTAGEYLKEHAQGENGECCILQPYNGGGWTVLAISFLSLIVIVAFLIIAFIAPRRWMYWQGRNQHQPRSLDSKIVEDLPCSVFNFASSNLYHGGETCAICLEDYRDGEKLKMLPCKHEFHSSCVDSWLTKWGTFCPVCKLDLRTNIVNNEVKRGNWP